MRCSRPSATFTTCAHVRISRSPTTNPTPAAADEPARNTRTTYLASGTCYPDFSDLPDFQDWEIVRYLTTVNLGYHDILSILGHRNAQQIRHVCPLPRVDLNGRTTLIHVLHALP